MALTIIIGSGNMHKVREIQRIAGVIPAIKLVPFADIEPLPEVDEDGKTFADNAGKKALLLAQYLYAQRGVRASGRHTAVSEDDASIERTAAARAREDAESRLGLGRQGAMGSRVLSASSQRIRPSDVLVVADDSGLEVDALGGAPGILSARYAGRHGDDRANNAKLLDDLAGVPDERRGARFVCAIALATQKGVIFTVEGKVEGRISREPRGASGFGYDPLFYYPPYSKTFGDVDAEAKDAVSHRANALKMFKSRLMRLLSDEGLA